MKDIVFLTDKGIVRDGLQDMLSAAIGPHDYALGYVDLEIALLVIEAAKRAEDKDNWFPLGKWATIQSLQQKTEQALNNLFQSAGEE